MDFRKPVSFFVTLDEIIEKSNSSEQRLLIKPMVTKLLDYYQPIYNTAIELEKRFKEAKSTSTEDSKRNKELAIWQGKRKKALLEILEILSEMLVSLLKLNDPLKAYHNDLMGCHTKVKT